MELRDRNGLTEAEYLAGYDSDKYPKPSVTADIVVIAEDGAKRRVLLIRRGNHPFLGQWALPGGFAEPGETVERSAARELEEETCLTGVPMALCCVASNPGRDPRGWTVSAVFTAHVNAADLKPQAADDAAEAGWFEIDRRPDAIALTCGDYALTIPLNPDGTANWRDNRGPDRLAFDHGEVIAKAIG